MIGNFEFAKGTRFLFGMIEKLLGEKHFGKLKTAYMCPLSLYEGSMLATETTKLPQQAKRYAETHPLISFSQIIK